MTTSSVTISVIESLHIKVNTLQTLHIKVNTLRCIYLTDDVMYLP